VARVVAFIPDLLFGSNVVGALGAAGHETTLVSDGDSLVRELPGAEVLIVDLTTDPDVRIDVVSALPPSGYKTLAFYSHVEADVRTLAQEAGFDMVVPRSRMAREGGALVDRLLDGDRSA
jgi:hypothetical protein